MYLVFNGLRISVENKTRVTLKYFLFWDMKPPDWIVRDDVVFSYSRLDLVVKGNDLPVIGCYIPEERKGLPHRHHYDK